MLEFFVKQFLALGATPEAALYLSRIAGVIIIFLVSVLFYYITQTYLMQLITYSVEKTDAQWDNVLNQKNVFSKLANIAPAIVIIVLAPFALGEEQAWVPLITNAALIYIVIVALMTIDAFLNGLLDLYRSLEWSKDIPIRGFLQGFKIVAVLIAILLIASIVLDKTVFYILGTLGAATAVLMLIFQDSILSLVAGIQLTANQMIARDDIITMPSFDADGTVKEITLTTIMVQNNDKSITTIPTRALINASFKNWRGMIEAGGRRIKRSLLLDLNSIQSFADVETSELNELLQKNGVVNENGRFESNAGAFRAYALAQLKNHSDIHQENFTQLVRQLPLTEFGMPIEVYAFSSQMDWIQFENMQAALFEHLILILPKFGLRLYQRPAALDEWGPGIRD